MTTSTTDAEAIARIIRLAMYDSSASEGPDELSRIAGTYASAIISYLASRREAQEPVAWRYRYEADLPWHVAEFTNEVPKRGDQFPWLEIEPLYTAPPAPTAEVERPTPNERFIPRMLLLDDLHAVCVGGRWDGWKFYRHPDGQWVSLERLKEESAALNGGRSDG